MDVAPLEADDLVGKIDTQELVSTLHGWLLMIVGERVISSRARSFFYSLRSNRWRPSRPPTKISLMNTTAMTLNTRCRTLFAGAFLLVAALSAASSRATVSVPASADSKAPTGISAALHAAQQKSGEPDFLSPDEAFRFSALADGPDSIRLIWGVTDGYYLYRARIKASSDGTQAKLGELTLPTGETKMDEYFGKQEVYHHDVVGSISVARSSSGDLTVPLKVTYQGCATAGLCYPPITKVVNVVLPSPGATGAATSGGPAGADPSAIAAPG